MLEWFWKPVTLSSWTIWSWTWGIWGVLSDICGLMVDFVSPKIVGRSTGTVDPPGWIFIVTFSAKCLKHTTTCFLNIPSSFFVEFAKQWIKQAPIAFVIRDLEETDKQYLLETGTFRLLCNWSDMTRHSKSCSRGLASFIQRFNFAKNVLNFKICYYFNFYFIVNNKQ